MKFNYPRTFTSLFISLLINFFILSSDANALNLPPAWTEFEPILIARSEQHSPKMKLSLEDVHSFTAFLNKLPAMPNIQAIKLRLPKTSIELLRAVQSRGLTTSEAEKMAAYLLVIVNKFQFQNRPAFDENTSHIIGREWHEIDYSGEKMTWQRQKEIYSQYHITDFKSASNLAKFFPIESQLPYFKTTYRPRYPNCLHEP